MPKFIRKRKDVDGFYRVAHGKKNITIKGRQVFETKDARLIDIFNADPEIEELTKKMEKEMRNKRELEEPDEE